MTQEDQVLREKNLAIIKEFFSHTGPDRLEPKTTYYHKDSSFIVPFYFNGEPLETHGIDEINEQEELNVAHYHTWEFQITETFPTTDPDQFWFKIHGVGQLNKDGKLIDVELDPMVLYFKMKDGKIDVWEEYFNPVSMFKQAGIELPKMY